MITRIYLLFLDDHYVHSSEILNTFGSDLHTWLIIQSCSKITSVTWVNEISKHVGCISTYFPSQSTSNSRRSRALFTAFKLKRAFANGFPFYTSFIQPFVTRLSSSMISAYQDPHISWLVSIPTKFISVWKGPDIITCSMNLSGKVHLKGRLSYILLDRRFLSYIFCRLLLWLPLTAAIVLEQFRVELLAGV